MSARCADLFDPRLVSFRETRFNSLASYYTRSEIFVAAAPALSLALSCVHFRKTRSYMYSRGNTCTPTTTRQTTGCAHGASSRRRCRSRGPVAPSSSPLLSRLSAHCDTQGAQTISGNRRSSPCIRTRFEDASKRTRSRVSAQGRLPRSPQKSAREKRSRRRPYRTIG